MSLDFVSTRDGVDEQTRRCARLLASVIAQAVKDAATPLKKEEIRAKRNYDGHARAAIHFLFDRNSPFELYARLIGINPEAFRAGLLEYGENGAVRWGRDNAEVGRRTLRARVNWRAKSPMLSPAEMKSIAEVE